MQKIHKRISTSRGKKILLAFLLVIITAAVGGLLYWNYNKKSMIRNKLEDTIQKKTDGLYNIHYDDLQLDEVAGNLSVSNLSITYDSVKYLALRDREDAPPVLLNIHIPSIVITGVKTPRALLENEIVGKKLQINSPTIDIVYTYSGKDSARNTPTKEVYEQILGNLNLIKIDSLEITGAAITTRSIKSGRKQVVIADAGIQLVDLLIDSAAWADTSRLLFSKQMSINAGKISWSSANSLYNFSIDSVQVNSASKEIFADRFHMDPTMGEDAFVKSLPTQDDRFDFIFNDIRIVNVNFPSLLNEQLIADSLRIARSTMKIYRDLSIPRDKRNRIGKYPQQLFAKLPVLIDINKAVLSNCFIEYKEKNPRSNQAGKVQFHQTYAVINNLSNRKKTSENVMTANISSQFLNKAPLQVTWTFYMNNPNGRFDLKGKLGQINAQEINVISEPMGPARMEDGLVHGLEFNLKGSDRNLDGTMLMLYEDMKVALLERDKGAKELDKKSLSSLAANFLIRNSNPSGKKDEPRAAQVSLARDPNRSIFYLMWKGLFQGIQETVGIKKK